MLSLLAFITKISKSILSILVQKKDMRYYLRLYSQLINSYPRSAQMGDLAAVKPSTSKGGGGLFDPIDFSDLKLKLSSNQNEMFSTCSKIMNAFFKVNMQGRLVCYTKKREDKPLFVSRSL